MKLLCCHPSALMYAEIYVRLEPLGLELVAQAARRAGHEVRILDLQVFSWRDYLKVIDEWRPDAVGFGLNYLPNIPEVIDLAKKAKERAPRYILLRGRAQRFLHGPGNSQTRRRNH